MPLFFSDLGMSTLLVHLPLPDNGDEAGKPDSKDKTQANVFNDVHSVHGEPGSNGILLTKGSFLCTFGQQPKANQI